MATLRILLQTTIPFTADDWHVGRFSLLAEELCKIDGPHRVELVARNRDSRTDDLVLSSVDQSTFDELWLIGVDTGDGLTPREHTALRRFRERGGGLLITRDHQDLGSCLASIPGLGLAEHFRTRNLDPVVENRCDDDCFTKNVSWPNYHSGLNGNVQRIRGVEAAHPLLRRPDGSTLDTLPAHPHEGGVSATDDEESRVIAVGSSLTTGRDFNLLVAFPGKDGPNGQRLGRGIADSSFHHFADYNWDTRRGAPSFVTDPEGSAIKEDPALLADTRTFVHNAARWLAPA
jgi:hypothetical protein